MTDLTKEGAKFFRPINVPFRTSPQQRLFLAIPCALVDHARAYDRVGGGFLGSFFSFAFPRSATYSRDDGTLYMGEAGLLYRGNEKSIQVLFNEALNLDVHRNGVKLETTSGMVHLFRPVTNLDDDTIYNWNDMFGRLREYAEYGDYIDENLNLVQV